MVSTQNVVNYSNLLKFFFWFLDSKVYTKEPKNNEFVSQFTNHGIISTSNEFGVRIIFEDFLIFIFLF